MGFLQVWLAGYYNPARAVELLQGRPAPYCGLWGQGLRALFDGLLLYLPLALLGRQPSMRSFLTFLPVERYYAWSILLQPAFVLGQWLLAAVVLHLILRLLGYASDIDQILNITGMAALIAGTLLLVWDWGYVLIGGRSDVFLGISHLVIDAIWAIPLTVLAFDRILNVPLRLGLALNLLVLVLFVPLAMVLVRGPV